MKPIRLNDLIVYPIILQTSNSLKSFNYYLVKTNSSLALIDAGIATEENWSLFCSTLHSYGFRIEDIKAIYLTHHHSDHIGLLHKLLEKKTIPIYAHKKAKKRLIRDASFLESRITFFQQLYEEMGCGYSTAAKKQIDSMKQALVNNQHLALHEPIYTYDNKIGTFDILEMPGHSPDQVSLWNKDNRCLFAGDLLIEHMSTNALVEPDDKGERIPSLIQHINSLENCMSLPIDILFSGHGSIIYNPKELLKQRLMKIEKKSEKIYTLIANGVSIGNEIAMQLYGAIYEAQFQLVMSEIIGHLDYLESKGKVQRYQKTGVWHYHIKKEANGI